jgi:hypothetical protein
MRMSANAFKPRPDLRDLAAKLIAAYGGGFGNIDSLGSDIVPAFASRLLAEGVLLDGAGAKMVEGRPSKCHDNAQDYARAHPAATWWTGLALNHYEHGNGWASHSWAVTSHGAIIETTERRQLYFGLPAALDESLGDEFLPSDVRRIEGNFRRLRDLRAGVFATCAMRQMPF